MKPIADLTQPELRVGLALAFGTRFFVPPQEQGTATMAVQAYQDRFVKDAIERGWTETQEPEPENINWYFLDDKDPTRYMTDAMKLTEPIVKAFYKINMQTPMLPGGDGIYGMCCVYINNLLDPKEQFTPYSDDHLEIALCCSILDWTRNHQS